MQKLWLVALALVAQSAAADTVTALQARLAGLAAESPISASIEHVFQARNSDEEQAPPTGTVRVDATLLDGGLSLKWPSDLVMKAQLEARQSNPDTPKPISRAMNDLSVSDVSALLNAAPRLVNDLDGAELLSEGPAQWQGNDATLLSLKLNPKLSKGQHKYLKEMDATAKIWLDATGMPVAIERQIAFKGRAMLVISFEQNETSSATYQLVDDRLIEVRSQRQSAGSGGGQSGSSMTQTSVTVM